MPGIPQERRHQGRVDEHRDHQHPLLILRGGGVGAQRHSRGLREQEQDCDYRHLTFVIRQDRTGQGESGDNFYVVESGSLDIYVRNSSGVEARVGNPLGKVRRLTSGSWR